MSYSYPWNRDQGPACDNGGINSIINPQCLGAKATRRVTVTYHADVFGLGGNADTLQLCDACAKRVQADAEAHGYDVKVSRL